MRKGKTQWAWLSKNPDRDKYDYFKAHPKLKVPVYECYACEYADTHEGAFCRSKCILSNIWKNGCGTTPDSPYNSWCDADNDEIRTAAALAIVQGHEEAIKAITGKGSTNCKECVEHVQEIKRLKEVIKSGVSLVWR